jgi:hypothetical protein
MTSPPPPSVYVLLHNDSVATVVLAVFAELQDANTECLRQAARADVDLTRESSTHGPDKGTHSPVEPLRWDTADGVSCWVEEFRVEPRKCKPPSKGPA